jgi:hypothetical protein
MPVLHLFPCVTQRSKVDFGIFDMRSANAIHLEYWKKSSQGPRPDMGTWIGNLCIPRGRKRKRILLQSIRSENEV